MNAQSQPQTLEPAVSGAEWPETAETLREHAALLRAAAGEMETDAETLRARAARLRAAAREMELDAQYADGPAYYNILRGAQQRQAQAAALEQRAKALEETGGAPC